MIPIQPLASSVGGGHVQIQRREALRAKSAFYRELLARRHDAYASSEALPLPPEDQPSQDSRDEQFVRATMTLPGGVSVTLERTDSDDETTTSVAVTRRNNTVRRAAPQPRRLDIRV